MNPVRKVVDSLSLKNKMNISHKSLLRKFKATTKTYTVGHLININYLCLKFDFRNNNRNACVMIRVLQKPRKE